MKKLKVVFYDIVKGYNRLVDDSIVYATEEEKNEIIIGYIKRFGYTNVVVEDGTIIILRTRL